MRCYTQCKGRSVSEQISSLEGYQFSKIEKPNNNNNLTFSEIQHNDKIYSTEGFHFLFQLEILL
jgi:hypothetical protein